MFYVLEGVLTVLVDGRSIGGPGTSVCAPPGTLHTFSNRTERAPVCATLTSHAAGIEIPSKRQ